MKTMLSSIGSVLLITAMLWFAPTTEATGKTTDKGLQQIRYGIEKVDDLEIFFREAGDPSQPTIVLLHGFPTSSHMYRNLMRHLASDFYLIAPDYPGFGDSSAPSLKDFDYTFDNLALVIDQFLEQRNLNKYSLVIQDFGAPVGFRIATKHPERVQSLIVQNGNAYTEGLDEQSWAGVRKYWTDKSEENASALDFIFTYEGLKWQYTHGVRNPEGISPDNWNLDFMKFSRPGTKENMLSLLYDYQNNLTLYPKWQAYLRNNQPPMLIVWGKNDAFFPEPGAAAYKRDVKKIDYYILDTGHFALEEEHVFVAEKAGKFLGRVLQK